MASTVAASSPACIGGGLAFDSVRAIKGYAARATRGLRPVSVSPRRLTVSAKQNEFPVVSNAVDILQREDNQETAAKLMAGSVFFMLSNVSSAAAAQEVLELAASDSRGVLLLTVLAPAVGWVLYNIFKPAMNQLDKMRSAKGLVGALGLGAAASLLVASEADAAQEIAQIAEDARPLILLVVLGPAVGWVLFNILQPALRQLNSMVQKNGSPKTRKARGIIGGLGLGAAASSMLAPSSAEAAQEIAQVADDARPLILLVVLAPAVGWVLFNILQPALRQLQTMLEKNTGPSKKRR